MQVLSNTGDIIHARRTRPLSVYSAHREIHILYSIDVILQQSYDSWYTLIPQVTQTPPCRLIQYP